MAARFVGRYEHSLDGKGRIILPARFRTHFESRAFISKHLEGCLAIWTPEGFEEQADRMALLLDGSPTDRQQGRAWLSSAQDVDVDKTGRVAIPQYLRAFAHLVEGQTVLVTGANNRIELWAPEVWDIQGAPGDASLVGPEMPSAAVPASTTQRGE